MAGVTAFGGHPGNAGRGGGGGGRGGAGRGGGRGAGRGRGLSPRAEARQDRAQAAARVTNVAPGLRSNNPLLNPNSSLSGKSLYQAAVALANLTDQGPISELRQQIAQNNRQSAGAANLAGGYYTQLGGQAQQGVNDIRGFNSQLQSQLAGIAGQENSQLTGIGQGAQNTLAQYTPGGAAVNGSAMQSLASEIARQKGLAAQEEGTYRAAGASSGQNYGGLASSQLGVNALAGTQAIKGILQAGEVKNEPLTAKIAALQEQRGSLINTDLGKLRQQEIANRISEQGLGLKNAALANTIQNDRANQGLRAAAIKATLSGQSITRWNDAANQAIRSAQINATLRGQNLSHEDRVANEALRQEGLNLRAAALGKGAKPLSTLENNAWLGRLDLAITLISQGGTNPTTNKPLTKQEVYNHLLSGQNPSKKAFSATQVAAAYDLLGWGYVTSTTARAMHAAGVRGGTFRGRPIRVGGGGGGGRQGAVGAGKSALQGLSGVLRGII